MTPPQTGPAPGDDRTLKRSALTLAVISSLVTPLMFASINIALPALGRSFALNAVTLTWVHTSVLLATAATVLPAGRLADMHGRKKLFSLGMALFGSGCLTASLAPSVYLLFTSTVIMGLGSALTFATGMAILSAAFPPRERGRAMGIAVASVYVGLSLGPFVGGMVTQYLGWRAVYAMGVPLSAIAFGVAVWGLKTEWIEAAGERFDLKGSLVYGAALVVLILGVGRLPDSRALLMILAGFALLGVFVWWENRIDNPVFEVGLFKHNRVFALSSLAALINYCATAAVIFLMSLYLQQVKGFAPREAGLVLIAQPVMMALLSPLAGRLSDRVQPRIVSSAGMALTAVGLFLLSFVEQDTAIPYLLLCLAVNGIGFGLFSSPNMNAIMSSVDKRYYGIASGAVASMRILGQMTSMASPSRSSPSTWAGWSWGPRTTPGSWPLSGPPS